jgi:hypothetical protein
LLLLLFFLSYKEDRVEDDLDEVVDDELDEERFSLGDMDNIIDEDDDPVEPTNDCVVVRDSSKSILSNI